MRRKFNEKKNKRSFFFSIRLNIGARVAPVPVVIDDPVVSGPPSQRLRNKRARREIDDDDDVAVMSNGH